MAKILVIDDEDVFRETTSAALQKRGFETIEAADGASGVELARRQIPDLIICDVNMDRMDGYSALQELRKEPFTATIPFILTTGLVQDHTMRQGMNLGADDFLEKPFNATQLFAAVDARLQKQHTLKQSAEQKLTELRTNLTLALPHEMITPLNGIFGLAEILQNDAGDLPPEEAKELAGGILQSAHRLHHLVQNFLLFGRLELLRHDAEGLAAVRSTRTSEVHLQIEEVAGVLVDKAGRRADLHVEAAAGCVAMAADLFGKIVEELVDNAVKFSQAGRRISVNGVQERGQYALTVSDEGDGIEPAQIARLGAYSQFDRARREQQGSGLGLTIVRRLAELHGGSFNIQSEPGRGTRVSIRIPG